jgi:hypothetical protein
MAVLENDGTQCIRDAFPKAAFAAPLTREVLKNLFGRLYDHSRQGALVRNFSTPKKPNNLKKAARLLWCW